MENTQTIEGIVKAASITHYNLLDEQDKPVDFSVMKCIIRDGNNSFHYVFYKAEEEKLEELIPKLRGKRVSIDAVPKSNGNNITHYEAISEYRII